MKATPAASSTSPPATPAQSSPNRRRLKQNIPWLIMFAPVAVYFILFKYVPMGGLVIAFKDYHFLHGVWGSEWAGLKNFQMLFTDPATITTIRNTLMISVLSMVVGFPFPIVLAIMFNEVRKLWFRKSLQTLLYLPHFLSWVIVGGMVITLFSQETGAVNALWERLTGSTYPFLYNEASWLTIFLGSGVWKEAGFGAIIYLAALANIDPHLYEAANLDGAGKFKQIWHITLPGITPVIVLMLILGMGRVMEVGFDQVYMLQNPVVSNISEVISTYIYRMGLQGAQFSITTAMGMFEAVIGLILVIAANGVARRFNQSLW
ncbi:ABC transporter permease subunit [Paenibacillus daejeonensis]|uniref:ABC transporter permease n=1 Tax=Paenibacillus daejeonensis TaxID=135193 RepID=UPI00037FCF5C